MDLFHLEFIKGERYSALANPGSALISESTARKYFGDQEPIGEVLVLDEKHSFQISAVFKDTPDNSHVKFDLLTYSGDKNPWIWPYCYIKLEDGATAEMAEKKIEALQKQHLPKSFADGNRFILQSLKDIHLHSHYDYEIEANNSTQSL